MDLLFFWHIMRRSECGGAGNENDKEGCYVSEGWAKKTEKCRFVSHMMNLINPPEPPEIS